MRRLLAFQSGRACALGCVLLAAMSGATLAQTTGAVSPKPAPAEPSVNEEPPPGGCMPIGLTASGEIVFPFQCKAFIERQKAADQRSTVAGNQKPAAAEQKPDAAEEKTDAKQPAATETSAIAEVKPAAAEQKPAPAEAKPAPAEEKPVAAEEKTAAKQQDRVVPDNSKPATERVDRIPLPKRAERTIGPPGCMHFRTYDVASGTYRTYDGRRRECREVVGQSAPK